MGEGSKDGTLLPLVVGVTGGGLKGRALPDHATGQFQFAPGRERKLFI